MALSDTAEYWHDIKKNYCGPNYFHIPNYNCGHRHLFEAKKLGDVNCKSCLKAIKEGYLHNLPEGKTISKAERRKLNAVKEQEELYGKCSCGALRTVRINKSTKEKFLGCTNYPNCKITSKI